MAKKKQRVLIVEDNLLNLKLFRDLLEVQGYEVGEAVNSTTALKQVDKFKPELILMDIQLQDCSGLDVVKKIKANQETKDIPIIAVTAFAMKNDKENVLAAGCQAYITKPISVEPFLKTITELLDNQEQLESA